MTKHILFIISSGIGLLPDGAKPLLEAILTYHQQGAVTFIWGQFHKILRAAIKFNLKIIYMYIKQNLSNRANGFHWNLCCSLQYRVMPDRVITNLVRDGRPYINDLCLWLHNEEIGLRLIVFIVGTLVVCSLSISTQPNVPTFITHANLKCKKYIHLCDEICVWFHL